MNLRAKKYRLLVALAMVAVAAPVAAAVATAPEGPALWALELGVPDLDRALDFYTQSLGFEAVAKDSAGTWALLANGEARLALSQSSLPVASAGSARAYPNFTVSDVATAGKAVVAAGGMVGEPFETPVGTAVSYTDPFGHPGNLIDHPWDDQTRGAEVLPAVFNVALHVRAVTDSEEFYTALGFQVQTRDYLPETLVFEPSGTAQLILHPLAEKPAAPGTEVGALLLDVEPGSVLPALRGAGVAVERTTPATVASGTATVELRDPDGNLLKLARRASSDGPRPASKQSAPR